MNKWFSEKGDSSDVVLGSEIRIARNLEDYPFPTVLSKADKIALLSAFKRVAPDGLKYINMGQIGLSDSVALSERLTVRPEFATNDSTRGLLYTENENISIQLGHPDHFRVYSRLSGLSLYSAFENAKEVLAHFEDNFKFAYDENFGYLTTNISNVGTGMRPSVILHLPGFVHQGKISSLASNLSKIGFVLKNLNAPSGSMEIGVGRGDLFRLANRLTYKVDEKQVIDNLNAVTLQIATKERVLREENEDIEENIKIAYEKLNSADSITAREMNEYLSYVRVGASNKTLPVTIEKVNTLMLTLGAANLISIDRTLIDTNLRDQVRAQLIKQRL
ncbi:MAG TPA: hypothetical protein GXZ23_03845 [Clostridiales bacterium]|nr:hypothetical protein [Clostridiales bacterium]